MPEHHSLLPKKRDKLPTGTASFLVIRYCFLVFVFCKEFQLKIVTKKIEWMAGIGKPRKTKLFGSNQYHKIKRLKD